MLLQSLNSIPAREAYDEFIKCCGSTEWARQMVDQRPFESLELLLTTSNRIWWSLDRSDWLEAFRSHPRIGEKKAERQLSSVSQKWSEQEQAGAATATIETQLELTQLNQAYERKFGYIYIVCATGKSSEQMLEILKGRMDNAPDDELRVAAAEQSQITELRLRKLINE